MNSTLDSKEKLNQKLHNTKCVKWPLISIIKYLYSFDLTHFRGFNKNPSKNLFAFLGDLKKIASEINWPLKKSSNCLSIRESKFVAQGGTRIQSFIMLPNVADWNFFKARWPWALRLIWKILWKKLHFTWRLHFIQEVYGTIHLRHWQIFTIFDP